MQWRKINKNRETWEDYEKEFLATFAKFGFIVYGFDTMLLRNPGHDDQLQSRGRIKYISVELATKVRHMMDGVPLGPWGSPLKVRYNDPKASAAELVRYSSTYNGLIRLEKIKRQLQQRMPQQERRVDEEEVSRS